MGMAVLRNWASYLFGFPVPVPIGYVIIGITYECNARCSMCDLHGFYPERPELRSEEMDLHTLLGRLRQSRLISRIDHIDLTGGEPFLRAGLKEFVLGLFEMPNIKEVSINSNGLETRRIAGDVEEILRCLGPGKRFSLSLSIDGIGALHDRIRGRDGAFARLSNTAAILRELRRGHPSFTLRSNTVIQKENVHFLDKIREFSESQGIEGGFSLIQEPYYTGGRKTVCADLSFTRKEVAIIKSISPKSRGMNHYLDNNRQRPLHCFAGYASVFIDPFGFLYPCNYMARNEEYRLGSIKDSPIDRVWASTRTSGIRERLKKCPETTCWNGCEVDQTLIQFDPLDKLIKAATSGLLGYYRLKGLRGFE